MNNGYYKVNDDLDPLCVHIFVKTQGLIVVYSYDKGRTTIYDKCVKCEGVKNVRRNVEVNIKTE